MDFSLLPWMVDALSSVPAVLIIVKKCLDRYLGFWYGCAMVCLMKLWNLINKPGMVGCERIVGNPCQITLLVY